VDCYGLTRLRDTSPLTSRTRAKKRKTLHGTYDPGTKGSRLAPCSRPLAILTLSLTLNPTLTLTLILTLTLRPNPMLILTLTLTLTLP
jgi:hypothetical protein